MKKKMVALLMVIVLALVTVTPVFAVSKTFSLSGVSGTVSLTKSTSSATGKTTFGSGISITASRTVQVNLTCTNGTTTYTYTDNGSATTNVRNYTNTTASISVYRPSSNYTVTGADSYHTVKSGNESYSNRLSA